MTAKEQQVLRTFQEFLMTPGEMLCFTGPDLAKHRKALEGMSERELLSRERVEGAYSLTPAGFAAMKELE